MVRVFGLLADPPVTWLKFSTAVRWLASAAAFEKFAEADYIHTYIYSILVHMYVHSSSSWIAAAELLELTNS